MGERPLHNYTDSIGYLLLRNKTAPNLLALKAMVVISSDSIGLVSSPADLTDAPQTVAFRWWTGWEPGWLEQSHFSPDGLSSLTSSQHGALGAVFREW